MVKNVTSLTRSGLRDWLIQRFSAIIIAAYVLFLVGFIVFHPHLSFTKWHMLFSHTFMRISSLIAFLAIMLHAYVGMWTIATDYLAKNTAIRLLFEVVVVVALLAFLIWGVIILWGL